MKLKSMISGIEGLKAKGDLDIDITGIESDSRKISNNTMFIAIVGFETDGHKYIKQAIANGAKAIMIQEGAKLNKSDITSDVTIVMAPDTRIAAAKVACNFYQNPSRKFKLIIWLTNLEEDQNDIDAGGSFSAVITFSSVTGGRLTATVEGYEDSGNNISHLGGV